MSRERTLAVLYDMAMVVAGEMRLQPLLTRSVLRLLYHTSLPTGLVFLGLPPAEGGEIAARLDLAVGDWELRELTSRTLRLPAALLEGPIETIEAPALLSALPCPAGRYGVFVRLPLAGEGVILLLGRRPPPDDLPISVFQPVLSNLARAVVLCRDHEAQAALVEHERDAARQGLSASFAMLRAMTSASLDAVVACDPEGKITYWNAAAERIFGWPAAEAMGRELHGLIVPARLQERAREGFNRYERSGSGKVLGKVTELEALRRDGSEFPAEVSVAPLVIDGAWSAVGTIRDLTERRRIEAELRQAQKLESVARLAGGVAHDFNNILTAILGGAEAVLEGLDPADPLHAEAQEIEAAARRAAALTRQLLAFSRKQVAKPVVLDVDEIVAGMGRMLKRLIGEDVVLEVRPTPRLAPVKVDPGLLEQVVLNLVVNARDAMPGGGRVTIETANVEVTPELAARCVSARVGPHVRIAVRDTGCGMTPEVLAHLFEPFFTTKPAGKGTGLGLSTVYGIVEQAGGHLHVESAPGKGSTFEVMLPATEDTAEPRPGAAVAAPRAARAPATVLVVDDDAVVRRISARTLRALGYTVLEASDGVEALGVAAGAGPGGPAALVTDVVMPRLGGHELARQVLATYPGLVVLLTSGYVENPEPLKALGPRAAFLEKPFTAKALGSAVRELLERGRVEALVNSG